jgi:hypothetical protein
MALQPPDFWQRDPAASWEKFMPRLAVCSTQLKSLNEWVMTIFNDLFISSRAGGWDGVAWKSK